MKCHLYDDLREQVGNSAREADDNDMDLGKMLGRCNKVQLDSVLLFIKRATARRDRILDTSVVNNQS